MGSNPFATRFIRPGAHAYLFPSGRGPNELVERLARSGWRGQIVGPHGSGKSTLLATLMLPLREAGRRVWSCALHDGEHRLPPGWAREVRARQANLVVIDGYEQLRCLSRAGLRLRCRLSGWGLLITTHRDLGLPLLYQTVADETLAQAVVRQLLAGAPQSLESAIVAAEFEASGGNLRETLFRLYDVWEARTRRPG